MLCIVVVTPIYVQMCHSHRMCGSYVASPYCGIITPSRSSEAPRSASQLTHVCYYTVVTKN